MKSIRLPAFISKFVKFEIPVVILLVLFIWVGIQSSLFGSLFYLLWLFIRAVWSVVVSGLGLLILLYPIAGFIALFYAQQWLNEFTRTNKIYVEPDGISLGWSNATEHFFAWEEITSVFLFCPENSMLPHKWLVGIGCSSGRPVKVNMNVVLSIAPELLAGIKANAPWVSIDPDLIELFEPAIADSRTELWLKSICRAPQEEQLMPLKPGDKLHQDSLLILSRIGVGGQGTAYLAKDLVNDVDVVIKETLFPVHLNESIRNDYYQKYLRETELLKRLDNPSVVRLIDSFIDDHRAYLVLDHVDGMSLRQLVKKEGRLPEEQVRDLARKMADVLHYLHKLSPPVVHRDFTPDNLILDKQGNLVLIDFNVAREMVANKTATVVGKHAYIPPEQFRGNADERSDLYAMGCTIFYLLTGEDPEPISCSSPKDIVPEISLQMNQLVELATKQDLKERLCSALDALEILNGAKLDGSAQIIELEEQELQEEPAILN